MHKKRDHRLGFAGPAALAVLVLLRAAAGAPDDPRAAVVASVEGRWTGSGAEVVWTTVSEAGSDAFRLVRVAPGVETPLPGGWAYSSPERPQGETRAAADPERARGETAAYRIEERRQGGALRSLGTWTVRFDDPPRRAAPRSEPPPPAPLSAPGPAPALKVPVAAQDIFSVSYGAIAAGLGLGEEEVADRAASARLAMRCGDEPVAYLADAAAGRILFHGWPAQGPHTRTNIFWIVAGDGLAIERVAPDPVPVPDDRTFPGLREREEDLVPMVERGILRDDLYFWKSVRAGHPTEGERSFAAPLDGYAAGPLEVTVRLLGWNSRAHRAEILFNGLPVGEASFQGREEVAPSFEVPAEALAGDPAGHELSVRGIPPEGGGTASLFVVDGFDLAYERRYEPFDGLLVATDGGNGRLSAARFLDPVVFEITDPHRPAWIAGEAGDLPADHSWAAAPGTRWAMRERGAIPSANPEPGGWGGWMRDAATEADYLVIAPRAFEALAVELAEHRGALGLRAAVALYEEICDQFAGGRNDPEAIRSLLIHARGHWAAAPWIVVLAGGGHYDYLGAQTQAPNFLPPLLASDGGTLRPADLRFADLTGDGQPDLAIGRIPARSEAQLRAYLDKLKAYEAEGFQAGHGAARFVADRKEPGDDFKAYNQGMAALAAARYGVAQESLDDDRETVVRERLHQAIQAGEGLVQYTGHGNSSMIADLVGRVILTRDHLAQWPGHLPVPLFLALSCYINRFDHPSAPCIGEDLVLRPGGGALSVLSFSGWAWTTCSIPFGEEFHRVHAVEGAGTIGAIARRTRRNLGDPNSETLRSLALLGDPALKLRGGPAGEPPGWVSRYAAWRWERFSYAGLADPAISGETADPEGRGWDNAADYAFGGHPPGLSFAGIAGDPGWFETGWTRRAAAGDIEFRIRITSDLQAADWQPAPPELELEAEDLGEPGIERVRARLPLEAGRLFLRLDVLRD